MCVGIKKNFKKLLPRFMKIKKRSNILFKVKDIKNFERLVLFFKKFRRNPVNIFSQFLFKIIIIINIIIIIILYIELLYRIIIEFYSIENRILYIFIFITFFICTRFIYNNFYIIIYNI